MSAQSPKVMPGRTAIVLVATVIWLALAVGGIAVMAAVSAQTSGISGKDWRARGQSHEVWQA